MLDTGLLLVSIFSIDPFISSFWYLNTIWVVSFSILYTGLLSLHILNIGLPIAMHCDILLDGIGVEVYVNDAMF